MRLSQHDLYPGQNLVAVRDVAKMNVDGVAVAQLAVDREIEHGQTPNLAVILQVNSNGPDVLWLQRWLLADQFAFVPWFPALSELHDKIIYC